MMLTGWEVAGAFAACALLGAIMENMMSGPAPDDRGHDTMAQRAMDEAERLDRAQEVCIEQATHGDPVFMWREWYDELRRCSECGSLLTNTWSPSYIHSGMDEQRWSEYALIVRDCGECGCHGEYRYDSACGAIVNACSAHERIEQAREAWLAPEYDVEPDDAVRGSD